jgi:uncharacterized protein (TIGR03085 family)
MSDTSAATADAPLDARERSELCDLFLAVGPDAPTLCEGWTTADLAAHLVLRERDPRAGLGIVLGGRFESMLDRLMEQRKAEGYGRLVDRIRQGPPIGPFALPVVGSALNLNEYFVHHEDVRRANGRPPRSDAELDRAAAGLLRRMAGLQLRNVKGAAVVLKTPEGEVLRPAKGTDPIVNLTGRPQELLLYLNGRRSAAEVIVSGAPEAIRILEEASLGI